MIRPFSFSTPNYRERQQRQAELAKLSGIEITQYTEADLPDWLNEYAKLNPRGYGFWRWKPWLTIHHANKCEVDDIVVYVDCGDRIDPMFWPFLEQYMHNNDILLVNRGYLHREWTRHLSRKDEESIPENAVQLEAGLFAFKKPINDMFFKWYDLAIEYPVFFEDGELPAGVHDHRHDQSVLTEIAWNYGMLNKSINLDHLIKWNQQH